MDIYTARDLSQLAIDNTEIPHPTFTIKDQEDVREEALEKGQDVGYESGCESGYESGYEEGWIDGKDEGLAEESTANALAERLRLSGIDASSPVVVQWDGAVKALVWTQGEFTLITN